MKVNYLKEGIGYGILIWVLMFAIVSAFVGFNMYGGTFMAVVAAIIAGVLSYVFAVLAKPMDMTSALVYGLIWVVAAIILDFAVSMRFAPGIFSEWPYWFGALLILLAPVLAVKRT